MQEVLEQQIERMQHQIEALHRSCGSVLSINEFVAMEEDLILLEQLRDTTHRKIAA